MIFVCKALAVLTALGFAWVCIVEFIEFDIDAWWDKAD